MECKNCKCCYHDAFDTNRCAYYAEGDPREARMTCPAEPEMYESWLAELENEVTEHNLELFGAF